MITSTMQQELPIESLKTILANLQSQISDLQNPQLMYRPPDGEKHVLITDYLDNVEMRLRALEKDSHTAPRTNHGERLTKLEEKINEFQ